MTITRDALRRAGEPGARATDPGGHRTTAWAWARHRAADRIASVPRPAVVLVTLGLAVLAFGGCAGADAGGRALWTTTVDTLPDGRVHVVNTPPDAGIRPTWMIVPVLRIGSADDDGAAAFGQVKGIVATEDGRIAVLDAQAQEIRVFAPDGKHLRTFGRKGSGPGELENANGMVLGPDGLIRVHDPANARISFFDPDRGFIRSHRIQVGSWGWIWEGVVDAAGRVWEPQLLIVDDERWEVLRAYDPAGHWAKTIPLKKWDQNRSDAPGWYRWAIPNGEQFAPVPFWPQGDGLYDPRGFLWHKRPDENDYRIFRITPPSDTTLVLESRRPAVPVTAAERDSAIAALRRQGAHGLDWSRIPGEKPIVQSLFVDDTGRLWVRVTTPDTLTTFDVYLPDGRYEGTAVTSLNIPAWWKPLVRGDRFYTLVTDELDVPYVVRARIRRISE